MEDFAKSKTVKKLSSGDAVYPGDVILSMEEVRAGETIFRQYTAAQVAEVRGVPNLTFFLVSRAGMGEPRAFGSIVRNRAQDEFVFDGKEWRRENGRPTTWDAISEGRPIEVVRDGLRG